MLQVNREIIRGLEYFKIRFPGLHAKDTLSPDDPKYSLAPVAKKLSELLKQKVRFVGNWIDSFEIQPGEVVLCENVRFHTW